MNGVPRIAFLLLMFGGLANCATPIGVRRVDRQSVRQMLSRDAISAIVIT